MEFTEYFNANSTLCVKYGLRPGEYTLRVDDYDNVIIEGTGVTVPLKNFESLLIDPDCELKPEERRETVQYRLPNGEVTTNKLIDREYLEFQDKKDGGVTLEPVSDNPNHVHDHQYIDSDGRVNLLCRDRFNQNVSTYIQDPTSGRWIQRPLTEAEKRRR